jgi:PAS domain S-box-containing protein
MPASRPPTAHGDGVSFLLIESAPAIADAVQLALQQLGQSCVVVAHGAAALEALAGADFGAVLLDASTLGAEALRIAGQIRALPRSRGTPLLFLTEASGTDQCVTDMRDCGPVDFLALPLHGGLLQARLGMFSDLHRSQRHLRTSEDRYRALFASLDVGVCFIDVLFDAHGKASDYVFVEVNQIFEQQSGLHDAVGKRMRDLVPEHEAHWFAIYGDVVTSGVPVRVVEEAKGLGRWFDAYASRVGGVGSHRVAVVFTDITAQRQAEQELQRLAAELAENDRRKTEFLATLAHELRNPLAPIRNGLEILSMSGDHPATLLKVRAVMERQVAHMVHLIDDLLDISRITRGQVVLKREPVTLRRIVDGAIETSRPLIDAAGHQLTVDLPSEALILDADPVRLSQVLSNLLTNAAKYTPAGGRITLAARRESGGGGGDGDRDGDRDGGGVTLSVTDNGVGIGAESLSSVFEMFTQIGRSIDRAQGGLGIGLTLVRRLTELHGGSVHASSDGPGRGSTFTVRLPLPPGTS